MGSADRPRSNPPRGAVHCSFCGKGTDAVAKMIAGAGVYICSECIALCFAILCKEFPAGSTTFRFAVRRADGSCDKVEIENVAYTDGTFSLLEQCVTCGTWNSGFDIVECLHCGAPLRRGNRAGGEGFPG